MAAVDDPAWLAEPRCGKFEPQQLLSGMSLESPAFVEDHLAYDTSRAPFLPDAPAGLCAPVAVRRAAGGPVAVHAVAFDVHENFQRGMPCAVRYSGSSIDASHERPAVALPSHAAIGTRPAVVDATAERSSVANAIGYHVDVSMHGIEREMACTGSCQRDVAGQVAGKGLCGPSGRCAREAEATATESSERTFQDGLESADATIHSHPCFPTQPEDTMTKQEEHVSPPNWPSAQSDRYATPGTSPAAHAAPTTQGLHQHRHGAFGAFAPPPAPQQQPCPAAQRAAAMTLLCRALTRCDVEEGALDLVEELRGGCNECSDGSSDGHHVGNYKEVQRLLLPRLIDQQGIADAVIRDASGQRWQASLEASPPLAHDGRGDLPRMMLKGLGQLFRVNRLCSGQTVSLALLPDGTLELLPASPSSSTAYPTPAHLLDAPATHLLDAAPVAPAADASAVPLATVAARPKRAVHPRPYLGAAAAVATASPGRPQRRKRAPPSGVASSAWRGASQQQRQQQQQRLQQRQQDDNSSGLTGNALLQALSTGMTGGLEMMQAVEAAECDGSTPTTTAAAMAAAAATDPPAPAAAAADREHSSWQVPEPKPMRRRVSMKAHAPWQSPSLPPTSTAAAAAAASGCAAGIPRAAASKQATASANCGSSGGSRGNGGGCSAAPRSSVLVAKRLTDSDVTYGRIILPRIAVEANLSFVLGYRSYTLPAVDDAGNRWEFVVKSWANGNEHRRVYALEQAAPYLRANHLGVRDCLGLVAAGPDGGILVQHNTPHVMAATDRATYAAVAPVRTAPLPSLKCLPLITGDPGQCTRNSGCTKPAGHPGFCSGPRGAPMPRKRRAAGAAAAAVAAAGGNGGSGAGASPRTSQGSRSEDGGGGGGVSPPHVRGGAAGAAAAGADSQQAAVDRRQPAQHHHHQQQLGVSNGSGGRAGGSSSGFGFGPHMCCSRTEGCTKSPGHQGFCSGHKGFKRQRPSDNNPTGHGGADTEAGSSGSGGGGAGRKSTSPAGSATGSAVHRAPAGDQEQHQQRSGNGSGQRDDDAMEAVLAFEERRPLKRRTHLKPIGGPGSPPALPAAAAKYQSCCTAVGEPVSPFAGTAGAAVAPGMLHGGHHHQHLQAPPTPLQATGGHRQQPQHQCNPGHQQASAPSSPSSSQLLMQFPKAMLPAVVCARQWQQQQRSGSETESSESVAAAMLMELHSLGSLPHSVSGGSESGSGRRVVDWGSRRRLLPPPRVSSSDEDEQNNDEADIDGWGLRSAAATAVVPAVDGAHADGGCHCDNDSGGCGDGWCPGSWFPRQRRATQPRRRCSASLLSKHLQCAVLN